MYLKVSNTSIAFKRIYDMTIKGVLKGNNFKGKIIIH